MHASLFCLLGVSNPSIFLSLLLSDLVFICLSGLREMPESHSATPGHLELEIFQNCKGFSGVSHMQKTKSVHTGPWKL